MTANECKNLVFSMRRWCQEVIREKGYPTHYLLILSYYGNVLMTKNTNLHFFFNESTFLSLKIFLKNISSQN